MKKTYLSKYWKQQLVVMFLIALLIALWLIKFCIFDFISYEDLIFVFCVFSILFAYVGFVYVNLFLVSYSIIDSFHKEVAMYSFFGKLVSSLDISGKQTVYYEVIRLIEGTFASSEYMILSNSKFSLYANEKKKGISIVAKKVIESKNQIIVSKKVGYEILALYEKENKSVYNDS